MKKIPFLICLVMIIIAAIICIHLNWRTKEVIGFIISFIINMMLPLALVSYKLSVRRILEDAVGIGFFLSLVGGLVMRSFMGAMVILIGSILGAVFGLMYKPKTKK